MQDRMGSKNKNDKEMLKKPLGVLFILLLLMPCDAQVDNNYRFSFQEDKQGIELSENGKKVFFYQKAPLSVGENPVFSTDNKFNHYIHPLYNLDGVVITEANPEDNRWHPHHRGIFWGWHQIFVNGEYAGDSWIMDQFCFEIKEMNHVIIKDKAELNLKLDWISLISEKRKVIVEEKTKIITYALSDGKRIIDFEINLKAIVPNVEIGGSTDTIKGYGGFSVRIHLADSMLFQSEDGSIIPVNENVKVGPLMDFSNPLLSPPNKYGFTILCHPSTPKFPLPWILREKDSMQNSVFPGSELITISDKKSTCLRYRIVIHEGVAGVKEINNWNKAYSQKKF